MTPRQRIWLWGAGFLLLAFLVQYGSLTEEVLDWDEATFMLMAQDVLRHHLPYRPLFDNKPPGMFFLLAGLMRVFGQSLRTVRLFGAFCVFGTASIMFSVCRRFFSESSAGLAACVMIAATAAPGFGLHTSTEKPVMPLLAGALWVMVVARDKPASPAAVGALLALAVLVRTNIACVVLATGLLLTLPAMRRRLGLRPWAIALYIAGGMIPLLALFATYAAAGALDSLLLCAVTVPLHYAHHGVGLAGMALGLYGRIFHSEASHRFWLFLFLNTAGLAFFVSDMFAASSNGLDETSRRRQAGGFVVLAFFSSTALSVELTGETYLHYLLQLYPFGVVFIGALFAVRTAWVRWGAKLLGAVVLVGGLATTLPATADMVLHPSSVEKSYFVRSAALAIAGDSRPGDRVWATAYQLVLFYLDEPPVTPAATHPDNMAREEIMTPLIRAGIASEDESGKILDSMPRYIVTRSAGLPSHFFSAEVRARRLEQFARGYELWMHERDLYVYRARR